MNCSLQTFKHNNVSDFTCNSTNKDTKQQIGNIFALTSETFRVLNVVLYSTIIFFGVTGNCLILSVVARWKEMRTPCNILISNISAADILHLLIAGSLRIVEWYDPWPFGEIACSLIPPLQNVIVCVSVVSHSAIALERQRALVTPFKPKTTFKLTVIFLVGAWIGCYLTAGLPATFAYEYMNFGGLWYCFLSWNTIYHRVYLISLITFFIVAQVIVQSLAYMRMIKVLYFHDDLTQKAQDQLSISSHGRFRRRVGPQQIFCDPAWLTRRKKKERLVKMLLAQVLTFQACWLFRCVIILIDEFWFRPDFFILWVSILLFYVQQVIHPLILFCMSTDFRAGVKKNCLRVC